MFAVMLGLVMMVASSVSMMGSFYLLPSPVLAADEGGSNGGGGSDASGSGDNSNGGSNDNGDSAKVEGKTENENTPPPNEGSGDKTTTAASEQPGATPKLPKCDGSFQDCVTTNGDVCKAGQGGHECECAEDMSDCPKHPSLQKTSTAGGPDNDCLFHPELPKCKSDNGKCPDGFFQNEDGNCFPQHDKCPKGYHSHENDETGRCIPDSTPCEPGFIRNPDFPTCSSKESVCRDHPQLTECGGVLNINIIIKNIIHKSGNSGHSSSSSSSLSKDCFDAIKITWLGKIHRGQNHEVDSFIDNCVMGR
jgi:hypothetical protein